MTNSMLLLRTIQQQRFHCFWLLTVMCIPPSKIFINDSMKKNKSQRLERKKFSIVSFTRIYFFLSNSHETLKDREYSSFLTGCLIQ